MAAAATAAWGWAAAAVPGSEGKQPREVGVGVKHARHLLHARTQGSACVKHRSLLYASSQVAAAMAAAVWGWVAMAAVAGPLEPLQ